MWLKVFYWMRLFTPTSFYVLLIRNTLYDIRYFLILYLAVIMMFANAILVANHERTGEDGLYGEYFGISYINAILN